MVGAGQPAAEAAQAAERHLKCNVLQLKPYRKKANNPKATEPDSKEVYAACLSCGSFKRYCFSCPVEVQQSRDKLDVLYIALDGEGHVSCIPTRNSERQSRSNNPIGTAMRGRRSLKQKTAVC